MNVFEAAKAYFAVRRAINNIEGAYKMDSATKPGWKTTEFWGKLAVQVFGVIGAVKGFLPATTSALIIGVLEGVYAIGRAIVKAKGGDLPDVGV